MNPLLLFLLLGESAGPRKKFMKRILPATLLDHRTGLALSAVFAKQDIQSQEQADKDQEQANKDIVAEVVNNHGIANEEALKGKFPKLYDLAYLKLPEAVQDSIFPAAAGGGRPAASRKP
jgi:hypothetical protein